MLKIITARYSFHLFITERLELPTFKGSTLRGAFGHALKKTICVVKQTECSQCHLKKNCAFLKIFQPEQVTVGSNLNPSLSQVPFMIEPPLDEKTVYNTGEELIFQVVLFGNIIDALPYFIFAFSNMGKSNGIGKGREYRKNHFILDKVLFFESYGSSPLLVYSSENEKIISHNLLPVEPENLVLNSDSKIIIQFLTPTKFVFNKSVVHQRNLTFLIFMKNLLRRLSNLALFHNGVPPDKEEIRQLLIQCENVVTFSNKLTFSPWTRYSNRQKRKVDLYGFTGNIIFEGILNPFKPYIYMGQQFHVGKSISMGMGRYKVHRVREGSSL